MFALLAALAFLLELLKVDIESVNLTVLGLFFLALHALVPFTPWRP